MARAPEFDKVIVNSDFDVAQPKHLRFLKIFKSRMKKVGLFLEHLTPFILDIWLLLIHSKKYRLQGGWLINHSLNHFKRKWVSRPRATAFGALTLKTNGQASDIEFNLPRPNYTAQTLAYLCENIPK